MRCELSICILMILNSLLRLNRQLGLKRHALDFDETGIGFSALGTSENHIDSKLTIGRESEVKMKIQNARVIVVNSEGDSKMSVTR